MSYNRIIYGGGTKVSAETDAEVLTQQGFKDAAMTVDSLNTFDATLNTKDNIASTDPQTFIDQVNANWTASGCTARPGVTVADLCTGRNQSSGCCPLPAGVEGQTKSMALAAMGCTLMMTKNGQFACSNKPEGQQSKADSQALTML